MLTLKIDDKWSIGYAPENNDRPIAVFRHGEQVGDCVGWNNLHLAMFYALLENTTAPQQRELPMVRASRDAPQPEVAERNRKSPSPNITSEVLESAINLLRTAQNVWDTGGNASKVLNYIDQANREIRTATARLEAHRGD